MLDYTVKDRYWVLPVDPPNSGDDLFAYRYIKGQDGLPGFERYWRWSGEFIERVW